MSRRRLIKPEASLHERLAIFAENMRAKAAAAEPGPERDDYLMRANQADTAQDSWAHEAGLQSPK